MLAQAVAVCLSFAAHNSHLSPQIIMTILTVEGGREGSKSHNTNGTDDFGPGQINTVWLDAVAKASGHSVDEAAHMLQWDGCFNIRTTAAILRYQIDAANGDFWAGVGNYHSREPTEHMIYLRKVVETAQRLFGPEIITKK